MSDWKIEDDLQSIIKAASNSFDALASSHIFLTGGTGFIGTWMLEAIRLYNKVERHPIQVTVLTRNPDGFRRTHPHLFDHPYFYYVTGDIVNLPIKELMEAKKFSHLIHGATDASAELNDVNPLKMFDTIVLGTSKILEFAVEAQVQKILYLSSGAVYGNQPQGVDFLVEDDLTGPNCLDPKNTYAEGKRAAEMLCGIYGKQFASNISIARIFALLGPFINLNIHFAAGNFIRDALCGKQIVVASDGRAVRSYLYPTDLVVSLLALLTRGRPGVAYNVGSEDATSILELAKLTSTILGDRGYKVLGSTDSGWNPGRYVPSNGRLRAELGVSQTVGLPEAIRRTALWNGWKEN